MKVGTGSDNLYGGQGSSAHRQMSWLGAGVSIGPAPR